MMSPGPESAEAREVMKIVDLTPEQRQPYFVCLEDWSEELKEGGNHKELWYQKMMDTGLRVKLAVDDDGRAGGMIQYVPIEHSFAEGKGLSFVLCIWVHGRKQGIGNWQGRGIGKALLRAAEQDAKERGALGMAAWGMALPVFMKASWFRKQGYKAADRQGLQVLLWKPFEESAAAPRWIRKKKVPETMAGKVAVTAFLNGWCPAMNMVYERAKRAAAEFGDSVVFRTVDTLDRNVMLEWGISDALFVGSRQVKIGPPPSFKKIRQKIARQVKKTS
jgi:GNAT superfamily N-acetyltransferase